MKIIEIECDKFKECSMDTPCPLIDKLKVMLEHGDELRCADGVTYLLDWTAV